MVQNKEVEEKTPTTNGDAKQEDCVEAKPKINGHHSEYEDSEEDDWLDHLLMLPRLDVNTSDRNKSLVSKTLLDFCSAIENRKEYQKIKQELMLNSVPIETKQEEIIPPDVEEVEVKEKEESPPPTAEIVPIEVKIEEEAAPETRRQSIRLNKAKFVPEHETPALNDQFFVCRRCTIFFRTRKLRKIHNMTFHRRKVNGVAIESPSLKQRRRKSSCEPFICDLCEKIFKQKPLLRSHMNTHMTEPQFFCSLCSYASKRNNDLKKHIEMHHNPDRIVKKRIRRRPCEKCDAVLDGKKALKLHIKENHTPTTPVKKARIFKKKCDKCEDVIEGAKAYRLHMKKSHSESSEIRCETCHRKFKTNFRLKKHKVKYSESGVDCRTYFRQNGEQTTFDCQHCEKKFLLKSHLTLHMKKHSNLTCGKCNVTFKNKFNLKWHEFSHLEIEPKCTHCAVNFTSEQKFAIHLKKKICAGNNVIVNGNAH